MLGNYVKDGEHTLRPHVTASLFLQAIEMRKRYGRRKWLGAAAMVLVAMVVIGV